MKLSYLLPDIPIRKNIEIRGITDNSSEVRPGFLFVAVRGTYFDGHDFIEDAIERGAAAVVCESDFCKVDGIAVVKVNSSKDVLWRLAKRFYGDPSSSLEVIGITGTNGKTTISYLLASIFKEAGLLSGLLGTINYIIGNRSIPADLTTPGIVNINKYLVEMVNAGCSNCIMEVSSHALEQDRIGGVKINVGVFTNLGMDHLDYHKTIENYCSAKAKLFEKLNKNNCAVVNIDDSRYMDIIKNTNAKIVGYGIKNEVSNKMYKKIIADKIEISASGMKFFVNGFDSKSKMEIKTKLLGYHNIYNILAAIGVALVYGIDKDIIKKGIMFASHIPGRLERLDFGQPFQIFVDYAHTPLALESALSAVSMIAKEKIILVFGCGGDRDRHKRPLMGSIAGTKADFSIITTDNPRNEDPDSIISDIKVGFNNDKYKVIVDRKEAIKEALDIAGPGDIVLIAGKGHENYQVLKNKVIPFNDSEVIKEALLSTTLEIGAR